MHSIYKIRSKNTGNKYRVDENTKLYGPPPSKPMSFCAVFFLVLTIIILVTAIVLVLLSKKPFRSHTHSFAKGEQVIICDQKSYCLDSGTYKADLYIVPNADLPLCQSKNMVTQTIMSCVSQNEFKDVSTYLPPTSTVNVSLVMSTVGTFYFIKSDKEMNLFKNGKAFSYIDKHVGKSHSASYVITEYDKYYFVFLGESTFTDYNCSISMAKARFDTSKLKPMCTRPSFFCENIKVKSSCLLVDTFWDTELNFYCTGGLFIAGMVLIALSVVCALIALVLGGTYLSKRKGSRPAAPNASKQGTVRPSPQSNSDSVSVSSVSSSSLLYGSLNTLSVNNNDYIKTTTVDSSSKSTSHQTLQPQSQESGAEPPSYYEQMYLFQYTN